MNLLTDSDVYVKNELFATLDPTARKLMIDDVEFLLVDTVGFLQDLPHNLIEAFKSTLESALHCDLALIVCDATGEYDMQMETTLSTLRDMQFNSPYLLVMNKAENISDPAVLPYDSIAISAKENLGIDELKKRILRAFQHEFFFCSLSVPYARLQEYAEIRRYITERSVKYTDDGQEIEAVVPTRYAEKATPFILKKHTI